VSLYKNQFGAFVAKYGQRKSALLGYKSIPVAVRLPQIPHRIAWDRNQSSEVRDRLLTHSLNHDTSLELYMWK